VIMAPSNSASSHVLFLAVVFAASGRHSFSFLLATSHSSSHISAVYLLFVSLASEWSLACRMYSLVHRISLKQHTHSSSQGISASQGLVIYPDTNSSVEMYAFENALEVAALF
jgi:hypothetical protein